MTAQPDLLRLGLVNPDKEKISWVCSTSLIVQASGVCTASLELCTGINTAVGNAILYCCY